MFHRGLEPNLFVREIFSVFVFLRGWSLVVITRPRSHTKQRQNFTKETVVLSRFALTADKMPALAALANRSGFGDSGRFSASGIKIHGLRITFSLQGR